MLITTKEEYDKAMNEFDSMQDDQFRGKECLELINALKKYEDNNKHLNK